MSELYACFNGGECTYKNCFHSKPHVKDSSCAFGCMQENGCKTAKCLPVTIKQPHKPTRKRSAPLYGELFNENKRLEIDNHNMRVCLDLIKNATLFGVLLWWFRNRKGGGK